jgi:hypothetical protein
MSRITIKLGAKFSKNFKNESTESLNLDIHNLSFSAFKNFINFATPELSCRFKNLNF